MVGEWVGATPRVSFNHIIIDIKHSKSHKKLGYFHYALHQYKNSIFLMNT